MRALLLLQLLLAKNRLLKTLHSPLLAVIHGLTAVGVLAFFLLPRQVPAPPSGLGGAGTPGAGAAEAFVISTFAGLTVLWLSTAVLVGVWQGVRKPPMLFSDADAVWLFASPVSSRTLMVYFLLRRVLLAGLLLLPVTVGFGLLGGATTMTSAGRFWLWAGFWALQAWQMGLTFAVYLATCRSPRPVGTAIRGLVLVAAVTLLALMMTQGMRQLGGAPAPDQWYLRFLSLSLLGGAAWLGSIPPYSWITSMVTGGGPAASLGAAAAGGAFAALVAVVWWLGHDYYEHASERSAQLEQVRQQVKETRNTDAVAIQFWKVRAIPVPIGVGRGGAWTLAWAQLVRYIRMQWATFLKIGLPFLGIVGVVLGVTVRAGSVPPLLLVGGLSFLSLFGTGEYLRQELKLPYFFTIPAPAWQRLLAASLVSFLDLNLNGTIIIVISALVGKVAAGTLGTLIATYWAFNVVSMGGLLLAATMLPAWVKEGSIRAFHIGVTALALAPVALLAALEAIILGLGLNAVLWLSTLEMILVGLALFSLAARRAANIEMAA